MFDHVTLANRSLKDGNRKEENTIKAERFSTFIHGTSAVLDGE